MNIKLILYIVSVALPFHLSGCSTVHSNYLAADSQLGYAYSGVNMDLYAMKGLIVCEPIRSEQKFGTSRWLTTPFYAVLSLVFLIDLPFSIVGDTLNLPVDMANEHPEHGKRWSVLASCEMERSDGSTMH